MSTQRGVTQTSLTKRLKRLGQQVELRAAVDIDSTLFLPQVNMALLKTLHPFANTATFSTVHAYQAHSTNNTNSDGHVRSRSTRTRAALFLSHINPDGYQGLIASGSLFNGMPTEYGRRIHGQEVYLAKHYNHVTPLDVPAHLKKHVQPMKLTDIQNLLIEDLFTNLLIHFVVDQAILGNKQPVEMNTIKLNQLYNAEEGKVSEFQQMDQSNLRTAFQRIGIEVEITPALMNAQFDAFKERHKTGVLADHLSKLATFVSQIDFGQVSVQSSDQDNDFRERTPDEKFKLFMHGKGPMFFHLLLGQSYQLKHLQHHLKTALSERDMLGNMSQLLPDRDERREQIRQKIHACNQKIESLQNQIEVCEKKTILQYVFDDKQEVIDLVKVLMHEDNQHLLGPTKLKAIQVAAGPSNSEAMYRALIRDDDSLDSLSQDEMYSKLWALAGRQQLSRPVRLTNGIVLCNALTQYDSGEHKPLTRWIESSLDDGVHENRLLPVAVNGEYYCLLYSAADRQIFFVLDDKQNTPPERVLQKIKAYARQQRRNFNRCYGGCLRLTDRDRYGKNLPQRLLGLRIHPETGLSHAIFERVSAPQPGPAGMAMRLSSPRQHDNIELVSKALRKELVVPTLLDAPYSSLGSVPVVLYNAGCLEESIRQHKSDGRCALFPIFYDKQFIPLLYNAAHGRYYLIAEQAYHKEFVAACADLLGPHFGGCLRFDGRNSSLSFVQTVCYLTSYFAPRPPLMHFTQSDLEAIKTIEIGTWKKALQSNFSETLYEYFRDSPDIHSLITSSRYLTTMHVFHLATVFDYLAKNSADVETRSRFYRCWMQLKSVHNEQVIKSVLISGQGRKKYKIPVSSLTLTHFSRELANRLNVFWDALFGVVKSSGEISPYFGVPRSSSSRVDFWFDMAGYLLGGFALRPLRTLIKLPVQMLLYGFESVFETIQRRIEQTFPLTLSGHMRRVLGIGIAGAMKWVFKLPRVLIRTLLFPVQSFHAASTIRHPLIRTYAYLLTGLIALPFAAVLPLSLPYFPKVARGIQRVFNWLFTSKPSVYGDYDFDPRKQAKSEPASNCQSPSALDAACVRKKWHILNGYQAPRSESNVDLAEVQRAERKAIQAQSLHDVKVGCLKYVSSQYRLIKKRCQEVGKSVDSDAEYHALLKYAREKLGSEFDFSELSVVSGNSQASMSTTRTSGGLTTDGGASSTTSHSSVPSNVVAIPPWSKNTRDWLSHNRTVKRNGRIGFFKAVGVTPKPHDGINLSDDVDARLASLERSLSAPDLEALKRKSTP